MRGIKGKIPSYMIVVSDQCRCEDYAYDRDEAYCGACDSGEKTFNWPIFLHTKKEVLAELSKRKKEGRKLHAYELSGKQLMIVESFKLQPKKKAA